MSLALRIFIVLTLVMTLAFMFIQMTLFATRENWKRRWNEETKNFATEVKALSSNLASESASKVKAEAQVVLLQGDITNLNAKLRDLENQITERAQKIQNLERDLAKGQQDYNGLKEDYGAQSKSLDVVRQRNSELTNVSQVARAVAFNLNVKLAEVEDDLNNAQTELAKRGEQLEQLSTELKGAKAFVAQVREKFPKVYEQVSDEKGGQAMVRAVVSQVQNGANGKADFIILSIGKEEGVQEGMEFMVYRNDSYICRVRVEKVMNDAAAARVIPTLWNSKGLNVQQGDQATNRL